MVRHLIVQISYNDVQSLFSARPRYDLSYLVGIFGRDALSIPLQACNGRNVSGRLLPTFHAISYIRLVVIDPGDCRRRIRIFRNYMNFSCAFALFFAAAFTRVGIDVDEQRRALSSF